LTHIERSHARTRVEKLWQKRFVARDLCPERRRSKVRDVAANCRYLAPKKVSKEQVDVPSLRAERSGGGLQRPEVASSPACVLCVRCALNRVQLNHTVAKIELKIDTAARFRTVGHDPGDFLHPVADQSFGAGSKHVR